MVKYICSVDRGTVISYDKEVENVSLLDHFYVDYIWYVQKRMVLKIEEALLKAL
jgi:hypothetical protein